MSHSDFFAYVQNGTIQRLNVTAKNARKGLINFPPVPTDEDFRAFDFWPISGTAPAPTKVWEYVTGPTYEADAETQTVNRVYTVNSLTVGQFKEKRYQEVNAMRDEKLTEGFSYDFGGSVGVKALDTRTLEDRTNWLTAAQLFQAQIAAGNGAVEGATIRTTDNTDVTLSFNEAYGVVLAIGAHGSAIIANTWTLKNTIKEKTTLAQVRDVDITVGWP